MLISVIIPTYNRLPFLPLALDSLAKQNFNLADFEVIVIDDGSKEDCQPIIDSFKTKLNLKFEKLNHGGVCRARNAGIKLAQSDILAFFDDDAIADPNWLKAINDTMQTEDLIVGRVKVLHHSFWGYFAPHYDRGETLKPTDSLLEGNCAIKRSVFDKVGLFDENIDYGHEGQEFLNRANQFFVLKYCPSMIIYHDYAFGLIDYLTKQFKFGEQSAYLESKYGQPKNPSTKEKNLQLESLPITKKITIKIIARLGHYFNLYGQWVGKNK
jgi:glycosyltransferase involved in cell wall biosynthesis